MLRVDSVSKQFSGVRAVDSLSFEVRPGEIFALLGPNGAGKSTLVRIIVGIFRADSGSVVFAPEVRDRKETWRADPERLGYLPEERGLHRDMPVLTTLEYFGVLRGMPRDEARAVARDGLARMGLAERERDRVDALSKGNQQKVQFLAAVLHRPRFAALDEPFSGLDPVNQDRFLAEIRSLRDGGCTVLLSAHQMDLVETVADRLMVVDEGRAVLTGSLEQIRRETGSGTRLELGIPPEAPVESLDSLGGVARVTRSARDRVTLWLHRDATVGEVLKAVVRQRRGGVGA